MKSEWMWDNTYQKLYKRGNSLIKKYGSMAFYNEKEQLYLEMDMLGVSLRASLLQSRDEVQFSNDETSDNMAV